MQGKKRDESIIGNSHRNRGCSYGVVASARAAISGQCGQRHHHAEGVNDGKVLGKTTFERLGVVAPTQDELRHGALDVTAAVVAGNGSRKRTVGPNGVPRTVLRLNAD